VTAWADLDRLAAARPGADGAARLVVRDDRPARDVIEMVPVSTVIAIARVIRARRVLAERHGGNGTVIYAAADPPAFLVDAVTAAGGVVFDGARERVAAAPRVLTMQLDAAFLDLATVVRRRVKARTFADAIELREHELRLRPVDAADAGARWIAIAELAALAGEVVRERRAARWIDDGAHRFPLALDLGKGARLAPGGKAQEIVDGGAGSMRDLLEDREPARAAADAARLMPLLCDRAMLPPEIAWMPLVPAAVDDPAAPVVVWVEDAADVVKWPLGAPLPDDGRRARALANLAAQPFEISPLVVPFGRYAVVTGGYFAAESVLDRATMQRVASELGGATALVIATPARGQLIAMDAARAELDDEALDAFRKVVEAQHRQAPAQDRISARPLRRAPDGGLEPLGPGPREAAEPPASAAAPSEPEG
jgi:hypothetical protein